MKQSERREFLKLSAASCAFLGLSTSGCVSTTDVSREEVSKKLARVTKEPGRKGKSVAELASEPMDEVRVGIIGMGMRGPTHANHMLALSPRAKLTCLCDVRENVVRNYMKRKNVSLPESAIYTGSEEIWRKMVERDDLDLVIIATDWKWHKEMALYSMLMGKHVAVEVPAVLDLEGCWDLVDTAEMMQRHCFMMENVCYGDEEMWL
ncbi:MAG: Gfo/Idh/MocA family oxidoreductase, partial [Pseudomonadales bacterium]|nr:Gfo/Idh/MocA family oxidoreductase [Pseudomonadales bacterium]